MKYEYICLLTPDNFKHIAGKPETRKRNIAYIHPAIVARCGSTQCTYILMRGK